MPQFPKVGVGLDGQRVEKKHHPQAVMATQKTEPVSSPSKLVELGSEITNGVDQENINDQLSDIFGSIYPKSTIKTFDDVGMNGAIVHNTDEYLRFVLKQSGILYEDDIIQVGCKLEANTNLARLGMFYGNKTGSKFDQFKVNIIYPGILSTQLLCQAKTVDSEIEAGAQFQQLINVVCLQHFSQSPVISIAFTYTGKDNSQQSFTKSLYLPIFINKFLEPTVMTQEQFFARWKQLNQPLQEAQKIFVAKTPIDTQQIQSILLNFGAKILDNIDPNPENFVCAGILHTQLAQIGTLIRLEPNKQAKMYRLTIRSSRDHVANKLCELLVESF